MEQTRILMGMPITIKIVDQAATKETFNKVFSYFEYVDQKFSTYKDTSEITAINQGKLNLHDYSDDMKEVFRLCEETKHLTNGYFDINHNGKKDPSGLVKGWSIYNASLILQTDGFKNFYVDAGGDIQSFGKNEEGKNWTIGIKNPFNQKEIVKVLYISGEGVATSGTYLRGQHIYNPKNPDQKSIDDVLSLTVIGPNIYEADRFATPAFVMGMDGINFIERLEGFEGYLIDRTGKATFTSGFAKYTKEI